jgi:superfamily II DNA/RNA helicase
VILFDFPAEPSEYLRRIGRTGRAGRHGKVSIMVYGKQRIAAKTVLQASREGKKIDPSHENSDEEDEEAEESEEEKRKNERKWVTAEQFQKKKAFKKNPIMKSVDGGDKRKQSIPSWVNKKSGK